MNYGKATCYLDFDGTLVDNKKRMYQFCCDYYPIDFAKLMTIDQYWEMKRFGLSEMAVLNKITGRSDDEALYGEKKLSHIEDDCYLALDEPFPRTKEALGLLGARYRICLVSRRERADGLFSELERFGFDKLLDDVFVLGHGEGSKADVIASRWSVHPEDVIVGDTEDDIQAGIELSIATTFVLSGIRNRCLARRFSNYSRLDVADDLFAFANAI